MVQTEKKIEVLKDGVKEDMVDLTHIDGHLQLIGQR